MRLLSLRLLILAGCLFVISGTASSQNFSFACSRDTLVAGCPTNLCITLKGIIPDLHGLGNSYAVNPVSSTSCFPVYSDPSIPGTWTTLSTDDIYSPLINIGFPFPFFGTVYNDLKVSSNGYVTFNTALSGFSHFGILRNGAALSATSGTPENLPSSLYAGAIIMGCYHDIDISINTSPNRRIQYTTVGAAPHRRWILSFYKIPLFSCNSLIENTHQIVLYESTGIVEVTMFSRENCNNWNQGRAMIGMQDITKTNSIMAPGRAASDTWGGINMNETWRFIPTAGPSLFKRVELYDMLGNLLTTGTVAPSLPGQLEASFPNICAPAGTSTPYVIKSVYEKFDDPTAEIFGLDTVNINRAQALTGTAATTPASCGTSDGTITVNGVSGGTPAYEYSLDGILWQSSNVFTGLAANTYTVYIRDNGAVCQETLPNITIIVTGTISETHSTTVAACPASATGSIIINSAGGTGPYTFSLNGGPAVPGTIPYTFNNLIPNGYTIQVYDLGTGCNSGPQSVFVPAGAGVTGSTGTTATTCAAVNDGTITATALTGTGPFTWSLDGAPAVPGASPYTFTNVSPGGHTVIIRDLTTGCNNAPGVPAFVNTGTGVTGSTSTTATACTGVSSGTITATALSGTGPFTWSLDGAPAVPGASPFTFTNVSAGGHTIIITDLASGCSNAPGVPAVVNTGTGVNGTGSSVATSCPAAANGSITVTATTGTAPFTWSLDGAPAVPGASPFTFNNVSAGVHNVVITDNNGCVTTSATLPPITVDAGTGVAAGTSSLSTSCPSAANGSITVTVTTGTAPYTYVLDGGAPQIGASPYTFNNLSAGSHTITVTDANGCSTPTPLPPVTVNAGPVLSGTTAMTNTSCSGATDGTITVTPVGGAAPFTWSLDGAPAVPGASPFTFNNVSATTHNVVITDAAGCQSAPIPANVTAGPTLTTTATPSAALCNGSATGSITVTVPTIGTGPYQYSLDNVLWQSSNVFNGLVANTYTVYYQSANGCSGSTPNVVVSAPASVAASSATIPVTCNGLSDGVITITANGGVPPYQYSINGGGTWQASNVFTVAASNYPNILIRDANNCTAPSSAVVTQPAALTASALTTNATCNGGSDGTITVTANGGNSGYQYSLDGTNFQSSNVFNVLSSATPYTVTIKDSKGCLTTATATVGLTNDLTFTPQTDPAAICEGTSTQLQLVSNAIGYAWTPSTGLSSASISNPVANPTTTTNYIVTMTLGLCTATDNVVVNVNAAPIPDAGPPGFICYGQTYTLQGSGGSQYTWTPSTYLDDPAIQNPTSAALRTITYTLSEVIDAIGCRSLTTDQVVVDVTPPIKVTTSPFDTVAYTGDQFKIRATSIAPNYTWTPAFNLSNANIADPVITVGPIGSDQVYQVTAYTAAGCKGEGYVRVRVYNGPDIYMSTAFTPNNDGKNDRFTPFPVGMSSIKYFRIFDRWGQLVFSSTKLSDGWDGKTGGVEQPVGVYVWMVEGVTKDNKVINKKGTVTLIR